MRPAVHIAQAATSHSGRLCRLLTWVLLVGAVLIAALSPIRAQEGDGAPMVAGLPAIDLPTPVERIYPAGERLIVGTSRGAQVALLIDAASGEVIARQPLEGTPRTAATYSPPEARGAASALAVVVEVDPEIFVLRRFFVSAGGGFRPADLPEVRVPKEFRDPGVSFVPFSAESKSGGLANVIWDRAFDTDAFEYLFVWEAKEQTIPTKEYPHALIPIGSSDWMLGLHPQFDRASIVNVLSGSLDDSVLVDRLGAARPEQTAIFVPGMLYGGNGQALVANGSLRQLIALSTNGTYSPLIDPPLLISLDSLPTDRGGGFFPWVAADRALSLILVGVAGSDAVQLLRRIRGGIGTFGTLSLGVPIDDAIALHGPAPTDPERFALLANAGRTIFIAAADDLEPAPPVQVPAMPPGMIATPELAPTTLNPGDIAQIQRVLGSFGYPVGAIDGVSGPRTTAAIRSFQYDNGLDPNGILDAPTISKLNASLSDGGQRATQEAASRAYREFLTGTAGAGALAAQVLTLGASQEIPNHPCFGLNDYPPEALWPRSVKFVQLLRRLKTDLALDVQVVSGYRTPAYTRCVGSDLNASHQSFAGFDIRLADATTYAESNERLVEAITNLQAAGFTTVEIEPTKTSLHVEPQLGRSHAVISSYAIDARGCQFAREDVDEFAALLAGTELRGREILIARTALSKHYAVTVDTNDDVPAARAATALVQKLSTKSRNRRTGADSYVQQNTDWSIDQDCAHVRVIQ